MNNLEQDLKWYFKHKRSKKRIIKILKTIEDYRGKTDSKLIKLCDEYANEVLGNKNYAPWLYIYAAVQNKFEEGWIPEDYYIKEVVPKTKGDYGKLADRNFMTPFLFSKIPSSDLGYYLNGKFCSTKNEIIEPETLKEHLFKNCDKLVYKLENSRQGKGVFVMDRDNFDISVCQSRKYANGVFQKFIKQHPFFSEFAVNSLATIRITTTSDSLGKISVNCGYIRFGRNTHTHILSNSAVSVPIDITTGELDPKAYFKWNEIDKHPDSKTGFANKQIPNFKKCLAKVIEMHNVIPFMGCIGWDVIVDESKDVQLIEWNGNHNNIKLNEATSGPCFKGLNWENIWRENKEL